MTFAEKMQIIRKQLFLSQEAMAKELGVSFATVNRWENGKCEPGYKAQKAFTGVAEELRVYNEDDVQELVNEVRYEKDI